MLIKYPESSAEDSLAQVQEQRKTRRNMRKRIFKVSQSGPIAKELLPLISPSITSFSMEECRLQCSRKWEACIRPRVIAHTHEDSETLPKVGNKSKEFNRRKVEHFAVGITKEKAECL
jgi:hypothetical protein